jgi:hypothetical protein
MVKKVWRGKYYFDKWYEKSILGSVISEELSYTGIGEGYE